MLQRAFGMILALAASGGFRMRGSKLEITAPEGDAAFEPWLAALPDALRDFGLDAVRRA